VATPHPLRFVRSRSRRLAQSCLAPLQRATQEIANRGCRGLCIHCTHNKHRAHSPRTSNVSLHSQPCPHATTADDHRHYHPCRIAQLELELHRTRAEAEASRGDFELLREVVSGQPPLSFCRPSLATKQQPRDLRAPQHPWLSTLGRSHQRDRTYTCACCWQKGGRIVDRVRSRGCSALKA
jgi:hypothetical protein